MGKNQQLIKLFVVIFLSTAFIFSSSHFGAKAFEKLSAADGRFSEGTTIGSLDVSGKLKEEAVSLLEEKYVDWVKGTSVQLQYGEKTAAFDMNAFDLDANQTVASAIDGQNNPATITVDQSQIKDQLGILFPEFNVSEIDIKKLAQALTTAASSFQPGSHSFDLFNDYLLANAVQKDAIIAESVVSANDVTVALQSIIDQSPKIDLPAGTKFSLLDFAEKNKVTDSNALNLLATGIYQAVLSSNFTIDERNIGTSLPAYTSVGFEARVDQTAKQDLAFTNPNKGAYYLELQIDNNQLKVTLKGQQLLYTYKVTKKDEQTLKPKTIVQYSPLVAPGKTQIQTKGTDGQVAKVYRDEYQGEKLLKSELVSEDYYAPVHQVEVHGFASSTDTATAYLNSLINKINEAIQSNTQTTGSTSTQQQETTESDIWGKPNEQPK
ncbi:G5 domain-containing protein [Neobacillus dielmonensis]|uniref:G5 domain-containing protein n=1 Tax=Neobacillus dielmonensis TaxID=1347369 RepID=UPI0005A86B21|nr:G5 domain-containing protein [Neobacillus dielmonensis]